MRKRLLRFVLLVSRSRTHVLYPQGSVIQGISMSSKMETAKNDSFDIDDPLRRQLTTPVIVCRCDVDIQL